VVRYLALGTALAIVAVASAGAAVFDANQKIALSPAIAATEGDVFVAWARLERMLKLGRFTLSPVHGGEAHLEGSLALTSRTDEPFAMVWGDDALFLGWIDYRTHKASLARYKVKRKGDFVRGDTRTTNVRARGGVSLAYDDDRLYVGYTDSEEDLVKVASYKVSSKGKLSRENERKLTGCETAMGSAIAVADGTLAVAWINSDKKFMLSTYEIEKSSKGPSFRHLKDTRTEIRVRTEPAMDKPALAAEGDEVYFGYVDRNDKTAHVKFYKLDAGGALLSRGETRVNERPAEPITVAASDGKVYVALVDANKDLLIAEQ
jgi:hypothetical protein